jgi:hypothetical protein
MEVVVRVRGVADKLGQELETWDPAYRAMKVRDAAGEVEYDYQCRVHLVGSVGGKPRSFRLERCAELAELGCQALALAPGPGL